MNNYYQTLGLSPDAPPRKIREQYRKLAKIYHPDRVTDPIDKAHFAEKFKELNKAYEALSEVVQRAKLAPEERKLDFLYRQGMDLLAQKKWSTALIVFNEILAIDSSYRDVVICLQEARRKHKHLATQYAAADSFYRQRKWTEAMQRFELVLREDPKYRDAAKKYRKARREQLMVNFMKQY